MKLEPTLEHALLGKFNALAVIAAWACLVLFLASLTYLKFSEAPGVSAFPLILLFGAFLAFTLIHFVLSHWVRCPLCREPLTAQGFTEPQYGNWSGAIGKWFTGSIVCIHCGARVNTHG